MHGSKTFLNERRIIMIKRIFTVLVSILLSIWLSLILCSYTVSEAPRWRADCSVRPGYVVSIGTSFFHSEFLQFSGDEYGYTYELHARDGEFRISDIVRHREVGGNIITEFKQEFLTNITVSQDGFFGSWRAVDWDKPVNYIDILIKKNDLYVGYACVAACKFKNIAYVQNILECKVLDESDTETVLTPEYLREQIDKAIEKYGPYILELYAPDEE